ncbi:protein-L-isoaspartate(D-aspartate) O-methyltransferase [Jiella avicenniae]|uniref:Protein-L-isoaspartate O-methyltransferase n=1 Tax=Jiella avicenniae TaxID=2907202 RepID=A0A9X1P678_9HYPH|nr:protein-L-isoaspartate(D-aspartate) O-methyltransferase [Jiella avicenniae]MCE7029916.1 protein-L-isoaspartate(D-aspartate) O-methyltransferase [Jiella avicenniae]
MTSDFQQSRERMVDLIASRGVGDERVLAAMREVPRENFVPPHMQDLAHEDAPLSIGEGQTISQPTIVAMMIEAAGLGPASKVLEVGAGSGYVVAVLSRIAGKVYGIERHRSLGEAAAERLERLGYGNAQIRVGDGSKGWAEAAPFDAIVVSAAAARVPEVLRRQLAIGGRLIVPVDESMAGQALKRITRRGEDDFEVEILAKVQFVPLIAEG